MKRLLLCAALVFFAFACGKDETGSPEMKAKCTQNGSCLFYTTEAEEKFVESASSFLNQQIDVKRISLE